ncbi:MAG: GNAT family protein [Actinomycetota bacterium]|nr:GNAT family protein [Actinomycetota bacterium]
MTVTTRLATAGDAPEMASLVRANREFMAPWEPERSPDYFTEAGQRHVLGDMLAQQSTVPHVIVLDGRLVGRIVLSNIVRGPLQSASLGYWVSQHVNGRGVARAAVAQMVQLAFDDLGLHRVEAGTLVHNKASQRVLEVNGFRPYGMAPRYLRIAGEWQDHLLFQRLADD